MTLRQTLFTFTKSATSLYETTSNVMKTADTLTDKERQQLINSMKGMIKQYQHFIETLDALPIYGAASDSDMPSEPKG